MEIDTLETKLKELKEKEKQIRKVVNRYMRIRFKRRVRKLIGIRLGLSIIGYVILNQIS